VKIAPDGRVVAGGGGGSGLRSTIGSPTVGETRIVATALKIVHSAVHCGAMVPFDHARGLCSWSDLIGDENNEPPNRVGSRVVT